MKGNEIRLWYVVACISVMELKAMMRGKGYGKTEEFMKDFQDLIDGLMDVAKHGGNTPDEMIRILASLMRSRVYKWM